MFSHDLTVFCHSALKGGVAIEDIIAALRAKAEMLEGVAQSAAPVTLK